LLLSIAFGMALSWVAAFIGLSLHNPETAQPQTMPGWLQPFVRVNPITVATDWLRGLLLGGAVLAPVLKTLLWIVVLTVLFAPFASRQYRRLA
jgi:ABC-type polysaccharide/polyol phosphate export permease